MSQARGPGEADPDAKPPTLSKKELEDWVEIFRTRSAAPGAKNPDDEPLP